MITDKTASFRRVLLFAILFILTLPFHAGAQESASANIPANDVFGVTVHTGLDPQGVDLNLIWEDGKNESFNLRVVDLYIGGEAEVMKKLEVANDPRPDSVIRFSRNGKTVLDYHIRPKLRRYRSNNSATQAYKTIINDWDSLPKASEHPFKIEVRRKAGGADLYLDGRFALSLEGNGLKELQVAGSSAAATGHTFSFQTQHDPSRYLPLDVAALGKSSSFSTAEVSWKPGWTEIQGIPVIVAPGSGSADVGQTREGQGNWALEVDEYLARSPFDGFLSEIHFSVPGNVPYIRAWVLCAMDPDPSKDPLLTTRIARYEENGVGGNQLVDTTISLPRGGEQPGANMTAVGTVTYRDSEGKTVEVPLYLVEVPLRIGEIIDLAMTHSSLNFEFFGRPRENSQQLDHSMKPDSSSTSAVQIFGVTLEKARVGLEMIQSQPANVFHNDEIPQTTVRLKSLAPAKGSLTWKILDVEEKSVAEGSKNFQFDAAGAEQQIPVSLKAPDLGWYRLLVSIQDDAGNILYTHPASFALLGKDQRKAKYDSPFGVWWFDGAHSTPSDKEFAGPVLFKAGLRKAGWTNRSEEELAAWYITRPQLSTRANFGQMEQNPEGYLASLEKSLHDQLQKWPHADQVLIFHESGPGNAIPAEVIGVELKMTEQQIQRETRYANLLNLVGGMIREKFPQLKTVVGNNSSSASTLAAVLRHGGNADYIDYIGIETPSQVFIPEKLQEWGLQGMVITKEVGERLSGRSIPLNGCYEFTYRTVRDLGPIQQAEWYARDVLISLANGFINITPAILFDAKNAYYNGLWGASGLLERGPSGYPKPSYVAIATLTSVFDQVRNPRQIPTGSTTVYALEFDRSDQKKVSAFWASRGNAEFQVQFAGETDVQVVDMYGRSRQAKTQDGQILVQGGTSPVYLIANQSIRSISLGARSFPRDEARARLAKVAAPLDRADALEIVADDRLNTPPFHHQIQLPIFREGKFILRSVEDEEKGAVIEVELVPEGDLNKYITEYTSIRLKEPVEIEGEPDAMGIWVKGNSNWGRILYEIEDAEGEIWRSVVSARDYDNLDWPGHAAVNVDGWNFVAMPFTRSSLFSAYGAGSTARQWVSSGGNRKIDFPIQLRGLIVEMNRQPLDLLDFKTAIPVIRLKDVGGIYAPRRLR